MGGMARRTIRVQAAVDEEQEEDCPSRPGLQDHAVRTHIHKGLLLGC